MQEGDREAQLAILRNRGHSAIEKAAEEIRKQLERGDIDTFIFAEKAAGLFLEREKTYARNTGGDARPIDDAYDRVRHDRETENLRTSLRYDQRSELGESGRDIESAIVGYFGSKNPEYKMLAYPPFINRIIHHGGGGTLVTISTATQMHIESLYKGLRTALSPAKSLSEVTQEFEDEEELGIERTKKPKKKKKEAEKKDAETLQKEAVFSLLLLAHIAQMQARSKAEELISESPISFSQPGYENNFWKSRLYGAPGKEGIEFCRGYVALADRALKDDLKTIFGENWATAKKMWDAVCFVQGEFVSSKEIAILRNSILMDLVNGDFEQALKDIGHAAHKTKFFKKVAEQFLGETIIAEDEPEESGAGSTPVSDRKSMIPSTPATREARRREARILKVKEEASRRIEVYERLKQYVGRIFSDKKDAQDGLPLIAYRITEIQKEIDDYTSSQNSTPQLIRRTISEILIVPYRRVSEQGVTKYKGKGIRAMAVSEFEKKVTSGELVDISDRKGFLKLFSNIKT